MNIDNYILELLQEATENKINLDPASVAYCFKKWNSELSSGVPEGTEARQLTSEQVEGAIRNFIQHIVSKNQFQFGFFMPGVFTLGYQALIAKNGNKPNLFQDSGLNLSSAIINIRFSPLERILLTNTKVSETLNFSIQNNEPKFSIGKFAKRDQDGKVITKVNSKGKTVPAEEEDMFEFTKKGVTAMASAKQKIEILNPFIEVLKDVKNYSLNEIKFILDQYNANTINEEANQLQQEEQFTILPYSPERAQKTKSEITAGRNLVFTSEDGKTRIYAINNQADAVRVGYYLLSVRERMENLISSGLVDRDGEYMGSQWCVTFANKNNSYYSSYRQHASQTDIKDYTFYFVMNDNLDFYNLSDEEIEAKPRAWRKLSTLKFYINMFCIQPRNHQGYDESRVRISPINNGGETKYDWTNVETMFPGISAAKEILVSKKFDGSEMVGGEENVGYNEDENSPRFIAAQTQSVKRTYIQGPYNEYRQAYSNPGTIANPLVWRSLDDKSKKSYFLAADKDNYLDMYKSSALFNEIKSNPQTFKDMIFYITTFHQIPNGLEKVKDNILKSEFNEKPYRVSDKNNNIQVLQKRNNSAYHLYDKGKMETYEKDGVVYDGTYQRDKTMLIVKSDNDKVTYTAERFNKIRGVDAEDTFWTIYAMNQFSYILTNNTFQRLIDDGIIHQVEKNINGKINVRNVIDDPDEIRRQQDIDEMIKGLR